MIRYYATLEVFGEKKSISRLKDYCKEHGIDFEVSEKFNTDLYAEFREEAKSELGFDDIFRGYMTVKNIRNIEGVLHQLDMMDDMELCIKLDL